MFLSLLLLHLCSPWHTTLFPQWHRFLLQDTAQLEPELLLSISQVLALTVTWWSLPGFQLSFPKSSSSCPVLPQFIFNLNTLLCMQIKTIRYKVISVFGCRKAEEKLLVYSVLSCDALSVQCKDLLGFKLRYENSKLDFLLSIPNNVSNFSLFFLFLK